jgi:hypothetical protein
VEGRKLRLIDADVLLKRMEKRLNDLTKEYGNRYAYTDGFEEGYIAVEEAPTVEKPRGEWVFYAISAQSKTGNIDETLYKCSNCGAICNGKPRFVLVVMPR